MGLSVSFYFNKWIRTMKFSYFEQNLIKYLVYSSYHKNIVLKELCKNTWQIKDWLNENPNTCKLFEHVFRGYHRLTFTRWVVGKHWEVKAMKKSLHRKEKRIFSKRNRKHRKRQRLKLKLNRGYSFQ
jgi:hypothetical protein